MARLGRLAMLRWLVLIVSGVAVATLGLDLLLPLGHKSIKDVVSGALLLVLGAPLMAFSLERLTQERRARERSRVAVALRRRQQSPRAEDV